MVPNLFVLSLLTLDPNYSTLSLLPPPSLSLSPSLSLLSLSRSLSLSLSLPFSLSLSLVLAWMSVYLCTVQKRATQTVSLYLSFIYLVAYSHFYRPFVINAINTQILDKQIADGESETVSTKVCALHFSVLSSLPANCEHSLFTAEQGA